MAGRGMARAEGSRAGGACLVTAHAHEDLLLRQAAAAVRCQKLPA